ncbi:hypothetical protein, partial [Mesorhizobium sp. M7A.F.Ca.US.001.02.1.1]
MVDRLFRLAALAAMVSLALVGAAAAQSVCVAVSGAPPSPSGTALGADSLACGVGAVARGGGTSIGTGTGNFSGVGNENNVAVGN